MLILNAELKRGMKTLNNDVTEPEPATEPDTADLGTPDVTEAYEDQSVEVLPQVYEAARENAGTTQSEISAAFLTEEDAVFFSNVSACTVILQLVFVMASSVIFCSSVMTHAPSNLDGLLGVLDLMVVDVTSASTVLLGIVCTHMYSASTATTALYQHAFASVFVDMWLATLMAVFFGSLYQLSIRSFHVQDIGLTVAEGLTSVRLFDFHQSPEAPHSINTFAWPVLCLLMPAYMLPSTFRATVWMHETLHEVGVLLIICVCVSGVLLVSIFASLRDESNIFYANASAVSYRWLEFNLGLNFYYLATINEPITMTLMIFTERIKYVIVAVYVCVWWAEFGVPVELRPTCIRVYHFGSCITDHPGVLIRGCFLGVCLATWITHVTYRPLAADVSIETLLRSQSTVLFCTPCFYIIKGALNTSFGDANVNANAALLALCMPVIAYAAVRGYDTYMKPRIQHEATHMVHEIAATCSRLCGACGGAICGCSTLFTRAFALRGSPSPVPG